MLFEKPSIMLRAFGQPASSIIHERNAPNVLTEMFSTSEYLSPNASRATAANLLTYPVAASRVEQETQK